MFSISLAQTQAILWKLVEPIMRQLRRDQRRQLSIRATGTGDDDKKNKITSSIVRKKKTTTRRHKAKNWQKKIKNKKIALRL